MAKKGVDIALILMVLLIIGAIAVVVFFGMKDPGTFLGNFGSGDDSKGPQDGVVASHEDLGNTTLSNGGESLGNAGAGRGGGGGGGGEAGAAGSVEEKTDAPGKEEKEPEGTLNLYNLDFEVVESDLAKVSSISYGVYNLDMGPMNLELLMYIYGDEDDDSQKGLVRDQIHIGQLSIGEKLEETIDVSAYYRGDLTKTKTFKLTLIGYYLDKSYNLGSTQRQLTFT
jgi:hypothetical protein